MSAVSESLRIVPSGKSIHHVVWGIEGLLSLPEKDLVFFDDDDGFTMSPSAAKEELRRLQSLGFTVLPHKECDHNPDGTCPGHPVGDAAEDPYTGLRFIPKHSQA